MIFHIKVDEWYDISRTYRGSNSKGGDRWSKIQELEAGKRKSKSKAYLSGFLALEMDIDEQRNDPDETGQETGIETDRRGHMPRTYSHTVMSSVQRKIRK